MANAVVLDFAGRRYLASPELSRPHDLGPSALELTSTARDEIRARGKDASPAAGSATIAAVLTVALGREVPLVSVPELRAARSHLPSPSLEKERARLLGDAHVALERALRTPEEILITLAREEVRLERAVGREARAAESFLDVPEPSVTGYARRWAEVRSSLRAHLAALQDAVGTQARTVVPNLSAVVGERTAARLVAEAGGVAALARMRAPRIQLLGSRRRPSPDRGPRFGVLFRADGMAEVPAGRRGAYARSLAALAAIAIRADAATRSPISRGLVARRDRRIGQLRARGR